MVRQFVEDCAEALADPGRRGKVAIYAGGAATIQDGDALVVPRERLRASLGRPSTARTRSRGWIGAQGSSTCSGFRTFPEDALETLNRFETLLVVDARRPVANFGYEGGPSQVMVHER